MLLQMVLFQDQLFQILSIGPKKKEANRLPKFSHTELVKVQPIYKLRIPDSKSGALFW